MKKFLFLVLPFALSFCSSKPDASSKPEEIVLVPWNSQESVERLARSEQKADFFPLSNNFDSQENGLVCGLASSSTVLNALRLRKKEDLPVDKSSISKRESRHLPKDYSPYFEKYTQENVFNKKTKSKLALLGKPIEINGKRQKDFGLQLHQLAQLLRSHGVSVLQRVVHDESESKTVREEIIENLSSEGDFILVNYARKSLNQTGGGHISPLGAYDKKTDSVLVMDVNPNKAPWVWVRLDDLIAAMRTFDTIENRGYLLISEQQKTATASK